MFLADEPRSEYRRLLLLVLKFRLKWTTREASRLELEPENVSFSAGDSLSSVMRTAVGARTRRAAQTPVVLEAVMRTLEKQTQ